MVDGFDSLSKEAVGNLFLRLGVVDRNVLFPFIGFRKVDDMNMFKMTDEDTKRVNTILKMWDYFGPSPENLGAGENTAANYLNADNIVTLGAEVGPYLPVIYPQMIEYFSNIFNKLYERGRLRLAADMGVDPSRIPDIKLPPSLPGGLGRMQVKGLTPPFPFRNRDDTVSV